MFSAIRIRAGAIAASAAVAALAVDVLASSHSDSPLTKQDPQTNLTDVYAFVGSKYDDPGELVLNVIVAVRPFSEPGDGPTHDRFADDARYSIHITDPDSGATRIRYDFEFSDVTKGLKNKNTILSYGLGDEVGPIQSIGDARQNFTQTYRVRRVEIDDGDEDSDTIGDDLIVAPPNGGKNVTPLYNDADGRAVSGATSFADLDLYTKQAVFDLEDGVAAFAGPRDDGFYSDIPGIFDLLNARILNSDGNGVDGFKGFNVLVYALQIPLEDLPTDDYESVFFGDQEGVGVFASVSRPRERRIDADGDRSSHGPWIQVNRQGNPVFCEALVALKDKIKYNHAKPTGDGSFAKYARKPELAALINFVFQTNFATQDREDLVNIFIPDVLRVNTTTGPVTLPGQPGFNRLGFIGRDNTGGVSSGWPNGRRLGDDVVDIALTAIASGPGYQSITLLGDNVNANDITYNQVFPYSATPHSGTFNRKDPVTGPSAASAGAAADLDGDGQVGVSDLLNLLGRFGATSP